jgi:hypothetical protein
MASSEVVSQFRELIATREMPALGPQKRPGIFSAGDLEAKLGAFFKTARVAPGAQLLLRSAALLWHDHLDASHTISQSIETRDGSWLHGIMHRREPDYGNAKYWFRRVGQHEAFPKLAERVAALLHNDGGELTERLIENGEWMPFEFVDACEQAEQGNDAALNATLRQIQAAEFDVLVEHILTPAS